MASKRCLPTRFFKDADIMNVSKDGQLILVGLVLLGRRRRTRTGPSETAQPGDRLPTRADRGSVSRTRGERSGRALSGRQTLLL